MTDQRSENHPTTVTGSGRPRELTDQTGVKESAQAVVTGPSDPPPKPDSVPITVLKAAGSVLGPVTVLTALMYYFGLLHAFHFFNAFHVDYTIFGLTTQDYLTRSADGLFVPLTTAAAAGLAMLWCYRLLSPRLDPARRDAIAPVAIVVMILVSVSLLGVALRGIWSPEDFDQETGLPGVALTLGVIIMMAATRLIRWQRRQRKRDRVHQPESVPFLAAEWTAVFLLVSVGLFWAAGDWSTAVGSGRGQQVLKALNGWPDAVLYTEKPLHLAHVGVREMRCQGVDSKPVYRYDGLHLIIQAGDQYLFLPTDWDSSERAIVIPKSDAMHLVFSPHGTSALVEDC